MKMRPGISNKGYGTLHILLPFFSTVVIGQSAVTLPVPETVPSDAVQAPPNFVSFGFETPYLDNFANEFSENLVSSLAKRMSAKPIIRIGGTSGDRVLFNADLKENKKCVEGACPFSHQTTWELGPGYFEAFKKFPNAKMTFQAPLRGGEAGKDDINIERTLNYVRNAYNALGKERVESIALGNEPSVYYKTADEYIKNAIKVEDAIISNLTLKGEDAKIFQALDTLSPAAQSHKPYAVQEVFAGPDGINKNGRIKVAAEHYYQEPGAGKEDWDANKQQGRVMNHTAIARRLDKYMQSMNSVQNVQYILSETGGPMGVSVKDAAGFGAALWSVDFQLTALTRGIKRVVDSGRPIAEHTSWVPDDSTKDHNGGPQVRAAFSADMFVADFIGKNPGRVVELKVEQTNHLLSAYAMYSSDNKKVTRLALTNLRLWDGSASGGNRGKQTFIVPVGNGVKEAKVRRLRADKGVGATGFDVGGGGSNVTWAGEQWSFSLDNGKGHFPTGKAQVETVQVKEGRVSIDVPDSEAVVVDLA
ncbi:hypothetical protein F5Y04DRAFT_233229 [Hypomontagnella monticulosa]|nr:hypothetical protein F5Y04DRAFT_233229 [Hypomontagnella monticulosa]